MPDPARPKSSLPDQLAQILLDFDDIQTELNYQQAQTALQDLVQRLDLSPRERSGLEAEIASLTGLVEKLESTVIHIAVFGLVGRGKSSLLNALVGQPVFETGPTHGVTRQVGTVPWQVSRDPVIDADADILRVSLPGLGNARIELVDTPGIDEVRGETREALAKQVATQADLILFLVSGDITQVEYDALLHLRQASKPMLIVFNKVDQFPTADRQAIYAKLRDDRLKSLISPDEIVMAAADPIQAQAVVDPDGQRRLVRGRGQPQVADLKLKILELLHREGKSLVALNTLLYADGVNEQILARKQQICDRTAEDIIWHGVMTKAIAVALNPITLVDLLSGAIIDVALILTLSRVYGIPMTQTGALKLLRTIALGLGGISASELLVTFGLSSLKGALGLSAVATGGLSLTPYVSVALTQAGVAGVATYSIGQVTKTYLTQGAQWGPDGPKATISQILDSLDETSILNRVKDELRAKLDPQRVDVKQE